MIYIENEQDKISVDEELIKDIESIVDFALKEEEVLVKYELSILLVDNETIKEINRKHRYIDRETDVLSFPLLDYPKGKVFKNLYSNYEFDKTYLDGEELVLGDIVISLEKALEQSVDYGHSFKREVLYLIIHSILHLLGYDHMEDNEKVFMREREEFILGEFNIKR
ncbi:rRNA maturation RNase YbeY [Clostridium sp. MSJ-4]|uniref:Endoribonuclease YbeY n=1 Tax=Clostridium simiarum TaxID=2841506 RepID=A0ABS6F0B0_9CLOT|nr:rRNA maturation RNase YbeY [Clostridium simiarum]MBU5591022.1 rRNA maturation RNase YbeY [Clostridium simiarum]